MSRRDDLYFIESAVLNRIKIGHTGVTDKRLRELRTGSPDPDLRLLFVLAGAGEHETRVHRAWASAWSHGEWFHGTPELREWIVAGAPLDVLPTQLDAGGMDHDIAHHHNSQHIEALLGQLMRAGSGS